MYNTIESSPIWDIYVQTFINSTSNYYYYNKESSLHLP